jgi:RNA polymerase sigma-70 factor (ECF subfamily)
MSQNNLQNLLILAQNGDKHSYSLFLTASAKFVGQKIRKWINRPEVAEELTQEVLIGIHRNLQTFLPGKSAEAWIMGITRFKVIDYFRKNPHKFQSLEFDVTTPDKFTNDLMETLDELPELLRDALIMTKVEGLSTREAAQRLSIKENALRTRLSRAMSRLKKELTK